MRDASWMPRWMDRLDGRGGWNAVASWGEVCHDSSGSTREGPLRAAFASAMSDCRRDSWEAINDAEVRSPVQHVMSMQSRD